MMVAAVFRSDRVEWENSHHYFSVMHANGQWDAERKTRQLFGSRGLWLCCEEKWPSKSIFDKVGWGETTLMMTMGKKDKEGVFLLPLSIIRSYHYDLFSSSKSNIAMHSPPLVWTWCWFPLHRMATKNATTISNGKDACFLPFFQSHYNQQQDEHVFLSFVVFSLFN